jgi:hypothetical protein
MFTRLKKLCESQTVKKPVEKIKGKDLLDIFTEPNSLFWGEFTNINPPVISNHTKKSSQPS